MNTTCRVVFLGVLMFRGSVCLGERSGNASSHWWPPDQRDSQVEYEALVNALPSASSLRNYHDQTASVPHIAGSPGDEQNIRQLAMALQLMSLEVQVHEFW